MSGSDGILALIAAETRRERLRLWLAGGMGAVVSAAAVALLGLSGWFIAGAALAGAAGPATAHVFNYLMPSAAIRLFAILRTGARYVERVAGHEAALGALARMRPALFRMLVQGRPEAVLRHSAGEASARLVEDVEAIQTLFIRRAAPFALASGAALSIGLGLVASPLAGLAILLCMGMAMAGGFVIARHRAAPAGEEVQAAIGTLKARLSALAAAAPELKAYGREAWAQAESRKVAAQLDDARLKGVAAEGLSMTWQSICIGLAASGALAAVTLTGGSVPMGALAALSGVTGVEAAAGLIQAWLQNGSARAGLQRLSAMRTEPRTAGTAIQGQAWSWLALGLRLDTPARIALVGPSGCGKTSFVERLMTLRAPIPGELDLGGVPLADIGPDAALARFAYAAQDVRLIDGTVRENLALADPDASDAILWVALEDAALATRFRADPRGLDTPVGPNGAWLSGGERRRLALARAYLRDAPWLVLDEPTEGLDRTTERLVLERLDHRLKETGQGLVMITHRSTAAEICRQVVIATGRDSAGSLIARLRTTDLTPA